jgi:hypothetical protein
MNAAMAALEEVRMFSFNHGGLPLLSDASYIGINLRTPRLKDACIVDGRIGDGIDDAGSIYCGRSAVYVAMHSPLAMGEIPFVDFLIEDRDTSVDTIVAMAVIVLRKLGIDLKDATQRLTYVSTWTARAWMPRLMPTRFALWDGAMEENVAVLRESVGGIVGDGTEYIHRNMPLAVASTAAWILHGHDIAAWDDASADVITRIFEVCDAKTVGVPVRPTPRDCAEHFGQCFKLATDARTALAHWLDKGKTPTVLGSVCAIAGGVGMFPVTRHRTRDPMEIVVQDGGPADGSVDADVLAVARGRVVLVESAHPDSIEVGMRVAPVVIHTPPPRECGRGYTIAAWSDSHAFLDMILFTLTNLESGWRMNGNLVIAPEDGSHLGMGVVYNTVRMFLAARA